MSNLKEIAQNINANKLVRVTTDDVCGALTTLAVIECSERDTEYNDEFAVLINDSDIASVVEMAIYSQRQR